MMVMAMEKSKAYSVYYRSSKTICPNLTYICIQNKNNKSNKLFGLGATSSGVQDLLQVLCSGVVCSWYDLKNHKRRPQHEYIS